MAAQQMLTGGTIMLAMGFLAGEAAAFTGPAISSRSLWAFIYLTVAGSLVGFTAYSWLLTVTTPARVSTYAYVNPVIAVLLGWAIGGEPLTGSMLVAAAVIVVAVIVLTTRSAADAPSPSGFLQGRDREGEEGRAAVPAGEPRSGPNI
jgi:drug/metabolite transporter (DMT)-like permease